MSLQKNEIAGFHLGDWHKIKICALPGVYNVWEGGEEGNSSALRTGSRLKKFFLLDCSCCLNVRLYGTEIYFLE